MKRGVQMRLSCVAALSIVVAAANVAGSQPLFGEYVRSTGLSTETISLSPNGKYSKNTEDDLGGAEVVVGSWVELPDGTLLLIPGTATYETSYRQFSLDERYQVPLRLIPVSWGNRAILVDDLYMMDFCNAVSQRTKTQRSPCVAACYSRLLPENLSDDEFPCVPPSWEPYLLGSCVSGRIVSVVQGEAAADLGVADGLLVGMDLDIRDGDTERIIGACRVLRSGAHRSELEITLRDGNAITPGSIVQTCSPHQ